MQTIWLQRSSPDIPWGFRLVGGREFGIPLTVQRVTPGGVAAGGLGPGDVILKIGNVMATNLEHNDAQELVRQATNILQLTIKKVEGASPSGPLSPAGPGYGSHMSAQYSDNTGSGTLPRGFGTGIPISSSSGAATYATTPRNYGSQYQPPIQGTRIEIQRERPVQQQSGYRGNVYHDENNDSGGTNFPDYTLAYRNQEPVHDSPGGPASVRGYQPPKENDSYNAKPWPQTSGGYTSNDRDGYWGSGGPPAYEPRSQNANQGSSSPWMSPDTRFNTGLPLQSTPQKPQQPYTSPTPQSYPPSYNSVPAQPTYNSTPGPFSPSQYSVAPNQQTSSTSGFASREPSSPDRQPSFASIKSGFEHPNISGSGSAYSTPLYSNSSVSTNVNSNYNTYNSPQQSQSFSQPQQYVPTQATNRYTPESFSPAQSRPYQSPLSPGSSGYQGPPTSTRKISFDQDVQENGPYTPPNFSGPYRPAPTSYSAPQYDYGVADFGISSPKSGNLSRQSSRHEDSYIAPSYTYGGDVTSARPEPVGYGLDSAGYYDSSGVSEGIDNISLGESHRYEPPPPAPAAPAPPPPPPPPPPGPPPPPAPPLGDWNATPYRRQTSKAGEEAEEQKIPDQILNTMLKSAKGGGPKPFSYGIDLSELKKKIGPPTAPKPRPGQPNYQSEDDDDVQTPRQYAGPPRKPAGHVQSDYFIKRDYDGEPGHRSKKPAGQVQSDYYQTRQTGPRSEVDESPININMGTNPKKQSKSFKVLQWMTETDKDDLEGEASKPSQTKTSHLPKSTPKSRRSKDPERRHNADDDEMRFSGLHSKADIPSKAFGILQKISADDGTAPTQNGRDALIVGDMDEGIGDFDETSVRYKGKSIPSPSFRVLQTWADHDPNPSSAGSRREEEEDDGLPETLSSDDMVDKRYRGGNIPSKVFKVLQKSVGDDTAETPSPPISRPAASSGQLSAKSAAPVSDF